MKKRSIRRAKGTIRRPILDLADENVRLKVLQILHGLEQNLKQQDPARPMTTKDMALAVIEGLELRCARGDIRHMFPMLTRRGLIRPQGTVAKAFNLTDKALEILGRKKGAASEQSDLQREVARLEAAEASYSAARADLDELHSEQETAEAEIRNLRLRYEEINEQIREKTDLCENLAPALKKLRKYRRLLSSQKA